MEYTKGEWKAESLFNRWHVEYDNFATICDIWAVGEEGQANAHLIAAAPDMYEALDGLMRDYSTNPNSDIFYAACLKAREALAKADGK